MLVLKFETRYSASGSSQLLKPPLEAGSWEPEAFLEFQPRLPRGLCNGSNPAVIEESSAVEHDALDPLRDETLGDRLAEHLCASLVACAGRSAQLGLQRRLRAGRRRDRRSGRVVDHLRVDVRDAAKHAQPRPLGRACDSFALAQTDADAPILL